MTTLTESRDTQWMTLQDQVFLAPMVRGSELAFRQVVRRYGVKTCYSPMLRANEVIKAFDICMCSKNNQADSPEQRQLESQVLHEDGKLLLYDVLPDPEPLVVQLCGNDPQVLANATSRLLELHYNPSVPCSLQGIDLNLGCPQSCALEGHFGVFLAEKDPAVAIACIAAMRKTLDERHQQQQQQQKIMKQSTTTTIFRPRLSCKIRLLDTDTDTLSFAQNLVNAGCEVIAVHCRQREAKSNGPSDLQVGRLLVQSFPSAAVIINGGIHSLDQVHTILSQTNAKGVMLATGLLRNPRLLVQPQVDPAILATEYLESCERYPPVSPLFIQKHFRWIFRATLEPETLSPQSFQDWRPRLWTFLVRPYLTTVEQFRQVIALYVKLNQSEMPPGLCHQPPDPTFHSIRHHPSRRRRNKEANDDEETRKSQ